MALPRFADQNTAGDDDSLEDEPREQQSAGKIKLDNLGHALGCGRLDVSIEAQNLNHARYLHDMLVPLVPIFAALSAASPIYKGELASHDHSWVVA